MWDCRGGSTVRRRERKGSAVLCHKDHCFAIMVTAPASFPGLPHLKILIVCKGEKGLATRLDYTAETFLYVFFLFFVFLSEKAKCVCKQETNLLHTSLKKEVSYTRYCIVPQPHLLLLGERDEATHIWHELG